MRSCPPRVRMGGGGQAPSGRGAAGSSTHSPTSSISPHPLPSDPGLCVIFIRLGCQYRSLRSSVAQSTAFPLQGDCLHHRGWSSPGLQVEGCRAPPNILEPSPVHLEPVAHSGAPAGRRGHLAPPGTAGVPRDSPPEPALQEGPARPSLHPLRLRPAQGRRWNGHGLRSDSSISPSFHSLICSFIFLSSFNVYTFIYVGPALV